MPAEGAPARTLFEKLWSIHLVAEPDSGVGLLHVDRLFIHDLHSEVFEEFARRGLQVHSPELVVSVADHAVSSEPGRTGGAHAWAQAHLTRLRERSRSLRIRNIDAGDRDQGIIHVIGPELGMTLPGMLIACPDSHTSTHGALGAMALGIGTTEILHILATQTLMLRKPRTMRITVDRHLRAGVTVKDLILFIIGRLGPACGTGHSVEFAGTAVEALSVEQRLTLCNLAVELGSAHALVAPDETTLAYVEGRPHAPAGERWDEARRHWSSLCSDPGAVFDREERIDAADVPAQVTWGTSPGQVVALDGSVPDPDTLSGSERDSVRSALDYMGLAAGAAIAGTPIDHVFIGSCANGRLSDLRDAAAAIRGLKVHGRVRAWVVPGSQAVKRDAEAEGLDRLFREAGFEWREPGCSMCVGANGDLIAPGARCVSTSNRNFVGRQGPGARTHLASPAVAAVSAVLGCIPAAASLPSGQSPC